MMNIYNEHTNRRYVYRYNSTIEAHVTVILYILFDSKKVTVTVTQCSYFYFDSLQFLANNGLVAPSVFNIKEQGLAHYIP